MLAYCKQTSSTESYMYSSFSVHKSVQCNTTKLCYTAFLIDYYYLKFCLSFSNIWSGQLAFLNLHNSYATKTPPHYHKCTAPFSMTFCTTQQATYWRLCLLTNCIKPCSRKWLAITFTLFSFFPFILWCINADILPHSNISMQPLCH